MLTENVTGEEQHGDKLPEQSLSSQVTGINVCPLNRMLLQCYLNSSTADKRIDQAVFNSHLRDASCSLVVDVEADLFLE